MSKQRYGLNKLLQLPDKEFGKQFSIVASILNQNIISSNTKQNVIPLVKEEEDEASHFEEIIKSFVKNEISNQTSYYSFSERDFNMNSGDYDFIKSSKVHRLESSVNKDKVDLINMTEIDSINFEDIEADLNDSTFICK